MKAIGIFVLGWLTLSCVFAQSPKLFVEVVEGKNAINNIKLRTARETVVEVRDENHRPVAGAAVVFLLPNEGPGGTFVGGAKSASVVTDSAGRARATFQPNQAVGRFQIRVSASFQGRTAAATISQSNSPAAAATGIAVAHAGISGKAIGIIVAVAAAGAAGAAVALKGKSNRTPPSPPPALSSGIITPGTGIALGPPR